MAEGKQAGVGLREQAHVYNLENFYKKKTYVSIIYLFICFP